MYTTDWVYKRKTEMTAFGRIALFSGNNGQGLVNLSIASGEVVQQLLILNFQQNPTNVTLFPFVTQIGLPLAAFQPGAGFYINPNGSVFQLDPSNFSVV